MKYIYLIVASILPVILTSFSQTLINTSTIFRVKILNVLQKCPALIRKMLVNMSDVVKTFHEHLWIFNKFPLAFRNHD